MATGKAPQLVMVAGPNGSGKSTLIAALLSDPGIQLPALYINADDLQRDKGLADPRMAQQLATALRRQAFEARDDVLYETVMSHPSKLAELQQAKAAGYRVTVHLVATEDPAINIERVEARVGAGGHDVPPDILRARYERTLALAPVAIAYADQALVFDNTQGGATGRGLTVHACLQGNRLESTVERPAAWVHAVAAQVNARAAEMQALAPIASGPTYLAKLAGGSTLGPILFSGRHYVLQAEEAGLSTVVHDRAILGRLAGQLDPLRRWRISYREGEAAVEALEAGD